MSTLNKTKNAEVEVLCTLETEAWKAAQEKAFNKLAKNVEIKGFRKGQAPKSMVRQMINEQSILVEAAESMAQASLEAAILEHNIELIDRPSLDIEKINAEECTLKFICPVKPDVELGQYKDLGYKVTKPRITSKEIDAEVEKLLESKAELELKEDGIVENGDTCVIDFEGFKDGVAFEGGKGENYDLTIGSGAFIPGFEEQLIGMKAEETRTIEVTFPEDYQAEELKGAKATFNVTVHEIKFKVLPELNDEFVSELEGLEDVKTVDDLKNRIKTVLSENRLAENENKAEQELLDKLMENCKVEVPEVMVEAELDDLVRETAQRLFSQYGSQGIEMSLCENIAKGQRDMMKEDASKRITIRLILEAIAKAENIEVTDEDVNVEYESIANTYGRTTEEIKGVIPSYSVKYDLTLRKALEVAKA